MQLREIAKSFVVYVFGSDPEVSASLKVSLAQGGYDVIAFSDWHHFSRTLESTPPHILYFSMGQFSGHLSQFVEKARRANPDLRFILLGEESQFSSLENYSTHGLEWIFTEAGSTLANRLLWATDRLCEKLYLQYQNEQLLKDLQQAQAQIQSSPIIEKPVRVREFWIEVIKSYRSASSKEEIIQVFLDRLREHSLVYFKYLPSTFSLVALNASGIPSERIHGLGCKLNFEKKGEDPSRALVLGMVPPELKSLLITKLDLQDPVTLPFQGMGILDGVLAYSQNLSEEARDEIYNEYSLASLAYSYFIAEKRLDLLEMQDPVTELLNARVYHEKLRDEVARARRGKEPLSLLKISIDDFYEIEQTMGESVRDHLLKKIVSVLTASARANDLVCRTALNELAIILPMCSKKGALLRAERLRRSIEVGQSLIAGQKISISVGISEFPTLCSASDKLDESASKALGHIREKGGNRICLFKAPSGFQPEFAVDIEAG